MDLASTRKVLTRFYLPLGATLIHAISMAVFGDLKSLDESVSELCKEVLAWKLQEEIILNYGKFFWHGSCKGQIDNDSHSLYSSCSLNKKKGHKMSKERFRYLSFF